MIVKPDFIWFVKVTPKRHPKAFPWGVNIVLFVDKNRFDLAHLFFLSLKKLLFKGLGSLNFFFFYIRTLKVSEFWK